MLIRELFREEKETCSCDCGCGKPVCESCGKPHAKKDIKKKIKENPTIGGTSTAMNAGSKGAIYPNDAKRDKNGVPKTVKGEIKMLDSMFKVAAIQQDISEVSLDDFINKADYFDLVIQNEQNAFDATKSTVITYLNKVKW